MFLIPKHIQIDLVPLYVAWKAGISKDILLSPRRSKTVVLYRASVAYLLRKYGLSLPEIGRMMNRHHTSVLHLLRAYCHKREVQNIAKEFLFKIKVIQSDSQEVTGKSQVINKTKV